jgi:hypothetical protein
MSKIISICFVTACLFFSGCANKEPLYRGVYEGLKMREQVVNPHDPVPQEMPGYDEYKSERDKTLEKQ